MKNVTVIKKRLLIITKSSALPGFITPAGISRIAVRALSLSKSLSIYLLKAIAALRANIIQSKT
jgi:hypothetical protein